MTEPLPDLVTKLKGDVSDLIQAFAEARAAEKAYQDENRKTADTVKQSSDKQSAASRDFARLVTANARDGRTALQSMQVEYDKTSARAQSLRAEFARAGDVNVFGDLKAAEADLGKLKGFLADAGQEFKTAGQDAGKQFGEGFSLFGQNPYVSAAMATAGTLLAVPLLAALDGAITAGIGVGGIAIGIAAAARQPAVQQAFAGLKAEAGSIFTDIGKEFSGPVSAGIGDIQTMLTNLAPGIKETFGRLSGYVQPLLDGIGGFIQQMLPGLEAAFVKAGPFIQQLADSLPGLGADIGQMFDEFASGGPGAAKALGDLLTVVGALAVGVGAVAEAAGKAYEFIVGNIDLLFGRTTAYHELQGEVASGTGELIPPMAQLGKEVAATTEHYNRLNTAFQDWIGLSQAADGSLLSLDRAQLTFNKELKKGPKYWNELTAAGQLQVGNLQNLEQALTNHYDDLAKLAPLTRAQTLAELDAAKSLYGTAKAAGATKPELATLANLVAGLTAKLNGMPKSETVHVNVVLSKSQLDKVYNTLGRLGGAANSGVTGGGMLPAYDTSGVYSGGPQPIYRFAEQSTMKEALVAQNGDRNRALSALATAASWFPQDVHLMSGNGGSGHGGTAGGGQMGYGVVKIYLDSKELAYGLIKPVNRMNGRSSTAIYGAR